MAATDDVTWLDIDVELLDTSIGSVVGALPPTSGLDTAFCTSTGDGALEHWVSASMNAFTELPAGPAMNLEIRVRGTLQNCTAGERWRMDDISTIVMR